MKDSGEVPKRGAINPPSIVMMGLPPSGWPKCKDFSKGIEGIKLSSVSDLIESKSKKFVRRFDCNYYQDSKSFINDNEIDAVIILTESGNHYRDAKLALNNGKHVITEKPACLIPNQITTLGKLAKKNKRSYHCSEFYVRRRSY